MTANPQQLTESAPIIIVNEPTNDAEKEPLKATFERRLICPTCQGKIRNIDYPEYDDQRNAIWTCDSCGGKYNRLIDVTVTNKPEKFSYQKPNPSEETILIDKLLKIEEQGNKKTETMPIELSHLNDIENPAYAGNPVSVTVTISSNSVSYPIPAKISADVQIKPQFEDDPPEVYSMTRIIEPTDPLNLSLTDTSSEAKERRLKRLFTQGKATNLKINEYRAIYIVRVRPVVQSVKEVDRKQVDESGREYKHFDIYVISDKQLDFQSASKIKLTGIPTANPKNQRTTLLAYNIEFLDSIETFDINRLDQLKNKFSDMSPLERWNWILDNAERDTQIIGRRNVAALTYLTYFTPLKVTLFGDTQRGWGLSDIIGDTTCGKSETVNKIQRRLNAGTMLSAETASMAGIIGAANQMDNGNWFVDWGAIPLMHRKLLSLDGCHKIFAGEWGRLAEAERSGILNIQKAAKAVVPAQTRQIKIFNAIDKETLGYPTKQLSEFLYQIQAYQTIADPTSIARRDFAVFVNTRDVPQEKIDQKPNLQAEPEYMLLSEALKYCWSNTANVEFTEEALTFLLNKSTELHNTFHYAQIPLVSADMKWKLARLSIAAAYLTLSTEDYKTLTVTKEHVDLVVRFLTEEYTKAGLNLLAQHCKFQTLNAEDVGDLFNQIEEKLEKAPIDRSKIASILRDLTINGRTTKDQLKTNHELVEKNQLIPLIATLQNLGLMRHGKGLFSTSKLIEAYKVTDGFATFATFAPHKNDPPDKKEEPQQQNKDEGVDSEECKQGKDGKTQQNNTSEIIHYQQLNPYTETHTCCRCQTTQAEVKMTSKQGSGQTYYGCQNCFNMYRFENEPQGVKFIEDQPELPPYPEEPMEASA